MNLIYKYHTYLNNLKIIFNSYNLILIKLNNVLNKIYTNLIVLKL